MSTWSTSLVMRKITTIGDDIDNHKSQIREAVMMSDDIKFEGQPLTKLAPASQGEIRDIIIKSPHYHVN